MTTGSPGPRRGTIVALTAIGLLAAGIALPGSWVGPPDASVGAPSGRPLGDVGSGDPPVDIDLPDLLRLLEFLNTSADSPAERPSMYEIRIEPDPIPGRTVTVTVTRDGRPVEGARVAFNGRPVGITDARGQVRGEVPYERRLVVTVTPPAAVEDAIAGPTAAVAGFTRSLAPPAQRSEDNGTLARQPAGNATHTVTITAGANVTVSGRPFPGDTVLVTARIDEVPMRDATVYAGGRRVGRTDEHGRYRLTVPDDGTERFTVRVTRGDFSATTDVTVLVLEARLDPTWGIAIPGARAAVRVRLGAEPLAGARVGLDGRRLGSTDAGGELEFTLPMDPFATLTVRAADQTVTRGFLGPYAVTGGLAAVAVAIAAAVAGLVRRRNAEARDLRVILARGYDRLARVTGRLIRWIADGLRRAIGTLARGLTSGYRLAIAAARGSVDRLRGAFGAGRRFVLALPGRVRGVVRTGVAAVRAAPYRAWRWLRARRGDGRSTDVGSSARPASGAGQRGIRELWRAFARWVSPADWRARTPGEIARAAIDRGLPADPVLTVTDAFRELTYAGEAPTEDRRDRARAAFDTLRAHRQERERDSDDGGTESR